MYNLTKNNYHLKPKNSNIQTPKEVSEFIFNLLKDKTPSDSSIIDPGCGAGNLLRP
jgi:type I restriction-modification system DNA methylase subunit